jgi:hypothetical protein
VGFFSILSTVVLFVNWLEVGITWTKAEKRRSPAACGSSSSMMTAELKVCHRAALDLVAELGVREVTGREVSPRGVYFKDEVAIDAGHKN